MYNPFSLKDKTILVTGASSGIGRSIAIECSKIGANVIITGRNTERLHKTYEQLERGGSHKEIVADITKQEDLDALVEQMPPLNGVVNSAGIPQISPIKFISRESLGEILNTNTISPILLISQLIKKKKILKHSSIVLIASMSGVCVANTGEASYATTKAALSGFTKNAALEFAPQEIRVNTICPGLVPTEILNLSNEIFSEDQLRSKMYDKYPLRRVGKPEDIAHGAIYLLSDASDWVTGINLVIDGGYTIV